MNLLECPTCHGNGEINRDYWGEDADECPDCKGRGRLLPVEALEAAAKAAFEFHIRVIWETIPEKEQQENRDAIEAAVWAFIDALPDDDLFNDADPDDPRLTGLDTSWLE